MAFSEISAEHATFTTQQYPLLGNNHIPADLNGDGYIFRLSQQKPQPLQSQSNNRQPYMVRDW
jgi:hypothetical protein